MFVDMVYRSVIHIQNFTAQAHGNIYKNNKSSKRAGSKPPSVPPLWFFAPNMLIRFEKRFILVDMVYRSVIHTLNFTIQTYGKICKNDKSSKGVCQKPPSVPPLWSFAQKLLIRLKVGFMFVDMVCIPHLKFCSTGPWQNIQN